MGSNGNLMVLEYGKKREGVIAGTEEKKGKSGIRGRRRKKNEGSGSFLIFIYCIIFFLFIFFL